MIKQSLIPKVTAWAATPLAKASQKANSLWRILTLSAADDSISRKRSIAICIEKGRVTIADGQRFLSRIRIQAIRQYPCDKDKYASPESLAETISLALKDLRGRNAEIQLGIPKDWSIIRTVEMPTSVKENLPDVMSYELDRLTPFGPDEAFYDFKILEENKEKIRISLAAMKAQLVRPYLRALREKGIEVGAIQVNLLSMATLLNFAGFGTDTIFLDINAHQYECASIQKGSVSSIVVGPVEGDDPEATISKTLREVLASPDASNLDAAGRRIIFYLRGWLADKSYPILERLVTVPYTVLNKMDLKLKMPAQAVDIPYAAIGAVLASLWPKANGMNLLSKGHQSDEKRSVAVTVIIALIALCAGGFFLLSPIEIGKQRVEQIDHQIALRKKEVMKIEAIRKEIDTVSKDIAVINSIKSENQTTLDIVRELTSVLPKNVWLARVKIADSSIDIEGYATGSAAELLPRLEASKYFQKVEFSSPTFRDMRMNADRFLIRMELEGIKNGTSKIATEKKK